MNKVDHTIMSWDLWDEDEGIFSLIIIPGTVKGFNKVVRLLYPDVYP